MSKYNQVIVVEGRHDEQKIKSIYPDVECIVTGGSEISEQTLNLIYQTSLHREIILFLDPDYPGKRITNRILETKGNYKIAFLSKEKAISKNYKKVGIEHASRKDIIASLNSCFTINKNTNKVQIRDLMHRKLINGEGASNNRRNLCKSLNLPILNGKAFLKTINMLGINLERIDELIGRQQ